MTDINTFPDFHDTPLAGLFLDFHANSCSLLLEPYVDEVGDYRKVLLKFSDLSEIEIPKAPTWFEHTEIYDIEIQEVNSQFEVMIGILVLKGPSWEIKFNCKKYDISSGWRVG